MFLWGRLAVYLNLQKMIFFKILFWASLAIVFYSYVGYGILLWALVKIKNIFKKAKPVPTDFEPPVTLVVAAFNEADFIEEKIKNTFELDYPKDKLQIIFITDGSSDATPSIVEQYNNIELLHQPQRQGKVAAMNRAIDFVKNEIVIFCDANTLLSKASVKKIAAHYSNPKVGGVAGEKRILLSNKDAAAAAGEGLYWKYESFLKKLDSDLYTTVGAAGELFSVRTTLFEKAPTNTIIEDFVQSLKLCINGYVVRYEPEAYAAELPSASIKEEMKRKVRICAGAFQAMLLLKPLFNFFKYPVVSFQFISHRILRWTLCPIALILLLISNILIVISSGSAFYLMILIAQVIFYVMGITGWIYANKDIKMKIFFIPFYFLFMNMAVFMGFKRFIKGNQSVLWDKAARKAA